MFFSCLLLLANTLWRKFAAIIIVRVAAQYNIYNNDAQLAPSIENR